MTLVLGIESSCDETAAALVRDGREVLGERVASQVDLHARFGGVIPEVASRSHLEALFPVIEDALAEGSVALQDVDAIAVTNTPGLVGCLLVGLSGAKGLALATSKPLIPVNHVHAHVYGALMEAPAPQPDEVPWPLASLVVSGGHTSLYASTSPTAHRRLGRTIDDAAGEAYDKVAALLGLGYPGGPLIDDMATRGDPTAYAFPRTRLEGLDFSFSGLKTAVVYASRGPNTRRNAPLLAGLCKEDLAASFQAAVVDVLVDRLTAAAQTIDAGGLVICGGVAANRALRERAQAQAQRLNLPLFLPSQRLATDNAVMIAGLGYHLMQAGVVGDLALDAAPRAD